MVTSLTRPVRVLIVDDDQEMLGALADLVADDARLELVSVATTVGDAVAGGGRSRPDVALVDVRMPDGGGEEVTRMLAAISPHTRVIAHSAYSDGSSVRDMVRAGAHGYLVKGDPKVDVVKAVLAQAAGQDTFQVPARWLQTAAGAALSDCESDNAWAVLFEESPAGKMLLGADLRPIRVNRALCEILGYPAEELCAMDVRDLADADASNTLGKAMAALRTGAKTVVRLEQHCRTRSGAMIWVELVGTLVRDARAAPLYIQTVLWDITDRKVADTARLESEARFRGLVEGLPGFVYTAALDGVASPTYVSPQVLDVTGYAADDYLSEASKWARMLHPDDRERVAAAYSEIASSGFEVDYRIIAKDGETRWVRDHGTVVRDTAGQALYMQGVVLDITRAKQNEEALLDSAAKTKFLASMSHELRTPLNSILGFAQLLATGSYGPLNDRQERYVGNINSSGQHLLALINDVLDLAKARAGQMPVEAVAISLNEAIADVLAKMRPISDAKAVELRAGPETDLRVVADRRRLHQVMLNLVSNAIKFTPAGGSVTVCGADVAGAVRVTVVDTGTGIEEADQARIFDEFVQARNAANEQGTGLGLTLTKQLVELMHGRIALTSRPGAGSTFAFTLPAAA
ncbi:MAG: PAS domain S-box protein [Chloroflexota bacterium]